MSRLIAYSEVLCYTFLVYTFAPESSYESKGYSDGNGDDDRGPD